MRFETYPFEKLSNLLQDIVPNSRFSPLALTIGEPQFETPAFIQEALKSSAPLLNKYPKTAGETILKEAMRGFVKRRFGVQLDDDQIIPTFGTREVLFNFPQFLLFDRLNPVMAFPNPFYQIYEGAAIASSARVIHLDLERTNSFKPDITDSRLKECDLVILNSPNNPTASVMNIDELAEWVRLSQKYGFVLLNDECYSEIYSKTPPPSLLEASIKVKNEAFENILVVNSISKRSCAPGLRSGFIAGDKKILKRYLEYRTYLGCASPLPLQYAARVAWEDDVHVMDTRLKYKKNFEIVKEILGLEPPEATFYLWMEVDDDIFFTKRLYEEYNTKVLPGSFLGRGGLGRGFVRLALVESLERTREALERIRECLDR